MSASAAEPQINSTVTYPIVVRNSGNMAAFGTTLTDPLPPGLRFVSAPGCSGLTMAARLARREPDPRLDLPGHASAAYDAERR